MPAFRTSRRIEFADTDAAGIAHFSTYFLLMEEAEHEFLRHVNLGVLLADDEGPISFPRVRAACDFRQALRFEDVVDIVVTVTRLGRTSVTYQFSMERSGDVVASGEITAVCCRVFHNAPPVAIPIPDWISQPLRATMAS